MGLFSFRKIRTSDRDLMKVQDAVSQGFNALRLPILDGQFIYNVALTSGVDVVTNHKLGRTPYGYIIVDQVSLVPINNVILRSGWTDNTITLLATSADVIVALWVF